MKSEIKHVLDALDLPKLGAELGVKERSFRLARERDVFPAAWYPTVKRHCEAAGVDCPMDLFNWKSPSGSSGSEVSCPDNDVGNATVDCKGGAA
jgi:hypothetical protein